MSMKFWLATESVLRRTMDDVVGVTENTVGCKIEVEFHGESCFLALLLLHLVL